MARLGKFFKNIHISNTTRVKIRGLIFSVVVLLCLQACSQPVKDMAEFRDREKALIFETVKEEKHAANLLALINQRYQLEAKQAVLVNDYRQQMYHLNSDYNTTPEAFNTAINDFNKARMQSQLQMLELVDAMKAETTAEEWEVIAKFQTDELNFRSQAYLNTEGEH